MSLKRFKNYDASQQIVLIIQNNERQYLFVNDFSENHQTLAVMSSRTMTSSVQDVVEMIRFK